MLPAGIDMDRLQTAERHHLVLIIDDDSDTVDLLKTWLTRQGLDVVSGLSGPEGLVKAAELAPDLILLDLMMPEMDGWETLQRLRSFSDAPIIIISAKGTKHDVVAGFESGVDDYLTKPLYLPELAARARAVLRRAGPMEKAAVYLFPDRDLLIELESQQVSHRGRLIELSPKEFALLCYLAEAAPRAATYDQITEAVWNEAESEERNRIKFLVHSLRQKLETDPADPDLIVNRTGIGYQLRIDRAA